MIPSIPPGSSLQGGAGGAAGPATATSNSGFDSSGWNVNYGAGSIDSGSNKLLQYAMLAALGFVAWKLWRRGR